MLLIQVLTDRALIESLPGKCPTYHFEWIKQEMNQIHRARVLDVGFQLCLAWKNNCLRFNVINSMKFNFLPFPVLTNLENNSPRHSADR